MWSNGSFICRCQSVCCLLSNCTFYVCTYVRVYVHTTIYLKWHEEEDTAGHLPRHKLWACTEPQSLQHTSILPRTPCQCPWTDHANGHCPTCIAQLWTCWSWRYMISALHYIGANNKHHAQDAIDKGWFRERPAVAAPPNMRTILSTATELASAMACLHANNILHGDLSGGWSGPFVACPPNVLVGRNCCPRLSICRYWKADWRLE